MSVGRRFAVAGRGRTEFREPGPGDLPSNCWKSYRSDRRKTPCSGGKTDPKWLRVCLRRGLTFRFPSKSAGGHIYKTLFDVGENGQAPKHVGVWIHGVNRQLSRDHSCSFVWGTPRGATAPGSGADWPGSSPLPRSLPPGPREPSACGWPGRRGPG